MLNPCGLTPDGVESMTLSELGNASRTVDKALELGSAFSTSLQRIANDEGVQYTREGQEFVRRDLLDLKRRILSRISLLRPQEELTAIKELIEQSDLEPKVRDSILESIDNSATLAEDDAEALKVTETELDRQALDFKERTMALSERRSKMRRAWFERDPLPASSGRFYCSYSASRSSWPCSSAPPLPRS